MEGESKNESKNESIIVQAKKIEQIFYSKNLLAGLFFLVTGILVFVLFLGEYTKELPLWLAIICLLASAFTIYRALARRMKMRYFFIAMFIFFTSILFLLCSAKIIPYSIAQLWPLLTFFSSISLLAAGFYQKKRLNISIAVPAVLLSALGFFLLLFSLRITDMHFFMVASKWWPALFVIAGVTLIVIFFCRNMLNFPQFEGDDEEGLRDD
ncbi:MAG: hypothetical protein Ta2A_05110 [Treponemataceae bacterium]|nr:MAG: hypothetical protein Ta2A_05110 [Treponemataceae bacterium]